MVHNYKTLKHKGKVIFSKMEMDYFKRIDKIFQENEACFMFVDNGDMLLRTPDRTLHIESGDGLLAKCGNYFFENNTPGSEHSNRTILIGAYFYPDIIQTLFQEDITASNFRTNYDADKIVIDSMLKSFRDSISFLLDNPEVVDEILLLTKLKELLVLLSKTESAATVLDFVSSLFKPYEYDFKQTITNNISTNLSLSEFAHLCGMSLASFKRKFKEYYTESPKQYLLKKKLEKAVELLNIREMRVGDIAYECGFESVSSFNRNFKNLYLMSPRAYRNKIKSSAI